MRQAVAEHPFGFGIGDERHQRRPANRHPACPPLDWRRSFQDAPHAPTPRGSASQRLGILDPKIRPTAQAELVLFYLRISEGDYIAGFMAALG